MKLLCLHCDYVAFKPKKQALKQGYDQVSDEELKHSKRVEEALVVFTSIELGDSDKEVTQAVEEVKKIYANVNAKNLVLYPYAHLSSNLASLTDAPKVLNSLFEALKAVNPDVYRSQFGWYKEFELKCKGHPLSELSKQIGGVVAGAGGATVKGPKKGDVHSVNEVIHSVILSENRNVGFAQDRNAYRLTAALALAAMLKHEHKDIQLGLAQLTENGFYLDVQLGKSVSPKQLPEMLAKLEEYAKKGHKVENKIVSKDQAVEMFKKQGEKYLLDLANKMPEDALLNLYCIGNVCLPAQVGLLHNTDKLAAMYLSDCGGAYWMKDSSQAQLQRVYGFSFADKPALESFLVLQEKAKERDHRKIGQQLDLFSIQDVAPGMPFFHPNGMIVRNEIEKLWKELHDKYGYVEIKTPILMNADVWKQSGHWDHYKENMYFSNVDGQLYGVKPMNCPGSIKVFQSSKKSYRDLPIRLSEKGLVHRHELSGVLSGLFRVRAFTQDDSHVYCREDQMQEELKSRLALIDEFYAVFGFEYALELSTRPPKRVGTDEQWDKAEAALKHALSSLGKNFKLNEGDGAFYGPKIDFHIKDSLGRSWQCATQQLDMQMPIRFEVTYEDKNGKLVHPVMFHSVATGSIERFMGILIEHTGGAFPAWLAPVQVAILPISDDQIPYAEKLYKSLLAEGVRVKLDDKAATIGNKIRNWQMQKVPYMIIVGKNEEETKTISVRSRDGKEVRDVKLKDFEKQIKKEIEERK